MMFNEYTGWKETKREKKQKNILIIIRNFGFVFLAMIVLYGMFWLGAALDFVFGV